MLQSPDSTSGQLQCAFNVDVGGTLSSAARVPFFIGSGVAGSTPAYVAADASPSHGTPIDFYLSTIAGTAPGCADGYGFPLSVEAGGSAGWAAHSPGNPPLPLCASASFSEDERPARSDSPLNLSLLPSGTSASGVSFFGNLGAGLTCGSSGSGAPQQLDAGTPAWMALAVAVTNTVNLVQFDVGFTDRSGAQGLLTAYWNTNRIGMADERVAGPGFGTYRFGLPATVTDGVYTLSFRLDSFGGVSSVAVTNVATGFVGLTNSPGLSLTLTNEGPVLSLTGTAGYTYLLQASTNLENWTPTALLMTSNGSAFFQDVTATNSAVRFYRAVMP